MTSTNNSYLVAEVVNVLLEGQMSIGTNIEKELTAKVNRIMPELEALLQNELKEEVQKWKMWGEEQEKNLKLALEGNDALKEELNGKPKEVKHIIKIEEKTLGAIMSAAWLNNSSIKAKESGSIFSTMKKWLTKDNKND